MKTRLGTVIGAERAADLYRAFLADIAARFSQDRSWSFHWAFEPAESPFPVEIARDIPAFPQSAGDLGARMAGAMGHLFAIGQDEVVLIGSDLPHLPRQRVADAFDLLSSGAELVLGPAEDGGYYLIGARSIPSVFSRMRWGKPDVLQRTLERARAAGLDPLLVGSAFDLDRVEDLQRLLADADALAEIPATRALLQKIFSVPKSR